MTSSATSRAVAGRRLHKVLPKVYAVGHRSPAPQARCAAALLYVGDDSALGCHAAAANHELMQAPRVVEVITPRRVAKQPGVRPRSCSLRLGPGEVTIVRGLRTTTIPRTLLDLAAVGHRIERLIADVIARRLVTAHSLKDYLRRRKGMPGAAALRLALEGGTTHSQIEREFKAWLKSRGIRLPSRNHEIGAIRVDCLWEDAALVVEVDTFGTHGTPFSFKDDRQRDAYLLARGFRTLRVTPQRWRLDGERLEREIRSALART